MNRREGRRSSSQSDHVAVSLDNAEVSRAQALPSRLGKKHIPNLPDGIPQTKPLVLDVPYFPEVPIPETFHQMNFYTGANPVVAKIAASHEMLHFTLLNRKEKLEAEASAKLNKTVKIEINKDDRYISGGRDGDDIWLRIDRQPFIEEEDGSITTMTAAEIDDYMKSIWQAIQMAESMLTEEDRGGRVVIRASPTKQLLAEVLGVQHLMEQSKPFTDSSAKDYLKSHYTYNPLIGHCLYGPQGTRFITPMLLSRTLKGDLQAAKQESFNSNQSTDETENQSSEDPYDRIRKRVEHLLDLLDKNNLNQGRRREAVFVVIKDSSGKLDRSIETHNQLYTYLTRIKETLEKDPPDHSKLEREIDDLIQELTTSTHFAFRENSAQIDQKNKNPTGQEAEGHEDHIDSLNGSTAMRYAGILRDDDLVEEAISATTPKKNIPIGRVDSSDPNNIHFRQDKLAKDANVDPDIAKIAMELFKKEVPYLQGPYKFITVDQPEGEGLLTVDPLPREFRELKVIHADERIRIQIGDGEKRITYELERNVFYNLQERYPTWTGLKILGDQAVMIPDGIKRIQHEAVNKLSKVNDGYETSLFQLLTIEGVPEYKWRLRKLSEENEKRTETEAKEEEREKETAKARARARGRGDFIQKSKWIESEFLSWATQVGKIFAVNFLVGRTTSESELDATGYDAEQRAYLKVKSNGIWFSLFNSTQAKDKQDYRAKFSTHMASYLAKYHTLIDTLYAEKILTGDREYLKDQFLANFFGSFHRQIAAAEQIWPEVKEKIEHEVEALLNMYRPKSTADPEGPDENWEIETNEEWNATKAELEQADKPSSISLSEENLAEKDNDIADDPELQLPNVLNILYYLDRTTEYFSDNFPHSVTHATSQQLVPMKELYEDVLSNLKINTDSQESFIQKTEAITDSLNYLIKDAIDCGVIPSSAIEHIRKCRFQKLFSEGTRAFLVLFRLSLRDIITTQSNDVSSIAEIKHKQEEGSLNAMQLQRLFQIAEECRPVDNSEAEIKKKEDFFLEQMKNAEQRELCLTDQVLREAFRALTIVTGPIVKYKRTQKVIDKFEQALAKPDLKEILSLIHI